MQNLQSHVYVAGDGADEYDDYDALDDLGNHRAEKDTAAIDYQRDHALLGNNPVHVAQGRAQKGMESQVWAWHTMQYTTDDRDEKTELVGDLHSGQLHRANRAARSEEQSQIPSGFGAGRGGRRDLDDAGRSGKVLRGGGGGGGGGGGRGGRNQAGGAIGAGNDPNEPLFAARKPNPEALPMAKGIHPELKADLFWDEPIV